MKQLVVLIFISISNMLIAQGNNSTKPELRKFTVDEKLDIAVTNAMSYMIMGISYAKSLGKTPEEFAEYSAKLVVPAYQFLSGKKPFEMINVMNTVQQTDKHFVIEINESDDSFISGRMNLFGASNIIAARNLGGVTLEDAYSFYNKFVQTLAAGVGFKYEYNLKDDWIVFKLTKL